MHYPAKCQGGSKTSYGTKSSVLLALALGSLQHYTVDSMPTGVIIGRSLL